MAAVQEKTDTQQHLTFQLVGEEYAIRILQVKEIIEYDVLTKVPKVPSFIRGVINLRGSVVPVVDLAVKFGLPETPVTKQTCIIIVEVEIEGDQTVMGVVVDAVSQVMDLDPQDIEATPSFGTKIKVDYLRGLGRSGEKFVLLLNIDKVLSSTEIVEVVTAQEAGKKLSMPLQGAGAEEADNGGSSKKAAGKKTKA